MFGACAIRSRASTSSVLARACALGTSFSTQFARCASTVQFGDVQVNINDDNTADVIMGSAPVNSLNTSLLTSIDEALQYCEQNKEVKGLVLRSSQRVFSAGLDIMEMYNTTPERATTFWRSLQDVWLRLYGTPLATVAALEGAAPAGGCLLAISCDYRVMTDSPKAVIGLNETQLGIVAPQFFIDTMSNTVSPRDRERLLVTGALIPPEEALAVQLIDRVTPQEDVLSSAGAVLDQLVAIPPGARAMTKQVIRGPALARLKAQRDEDVQKFVTLISDARIQAQLGAYLDTLAKRR